MTAAKSTAPIALDISRTFNAPVERVFDAWLSKEWGAFVGPRDITAEVTRMEPKVGGRYEILMHLADGRDLKVGGVYREIVRPWKLVLTWTWENEATETVLTLSFRAVDGKTELKLHHEGFSAPTTRDNHNRGWTATLDKLADRLAKETR
jgi:uncharacterized protein YndB with AHSA1/START domain